MEWLNGVSQLAQQSSATTKVIVATTAVVLIIRWATQKKYKLPPGPRPLPLLGNILELRGASLVDKFAEWKNKYGPVVTCYLGPQMVIVLNDFKSMNEAFVKQGSDFSSRPMLYSVGIMSDGYKDIAFSPYGDVWKFQRKITSQALRQYLTGRQLENRVHETLLPTIERLKQEKDGFNPHGYMSLSVCNVLHGLCFGTTLQIDDPVFVHMLASFDNLSEGVGNGFIEDFLPPLRWWPTKKFKDIMKTNLEFNDYVLEHLLEHKATFNPEHIDSFTDNVIQAQQQAMKEDDPAFAAMFTDDHAKQILVDVFAAGLDTSRQTLDWLFLVLVAYPDFQRKMQEEIDRVVGDAIPGKEHRSKLVYTEAVLMETMRLYYVVPVGLPHETLRDTTVGGYEVPAKVTVLTNNMAMMRDPKHWPDPLKFKPERFIISNELGTGSKVASFHSEGYAPFSLGHRACIGESLAKLELVYLVAGLLQKLTFSYVSQEDETEPDMKHFTKGITFLPKPYLVRVVGRDS